MKLYIGYNPATKRFMKKGNDIRTVSLLKRATFYKMEHAASSSVGVLRACGDFEYDAKDVRSNYRRTQNATDQYWVVIPIDLENEIQTLCDLEAVKMGF